MLAEAKVKAPGCVPKAGVLAPKLKALLEAPNAGAGDAPNAAALDAPKDGVLVAPNAGVLFWPKPPGLAPKLAFDCVPKLNAFGEALNSAMLC